MEELDFYNQYNRHYIRIRSDGCITEGWSDGPHNHREVTEEDVLLNDRGGYQFRLFPDGEENPALHGDNFVPLYKWDGEQVLRRDEEEIEAERAEIASALAAEEAERVANATETVLLEIAADHEERICLMELGVN